MPKSATLIVRSLDRRTVIAELIWADNRTCVANVCSEEIRSEFEHVVSAGFWVETDGSRVDRCQSAPSSELLFLYQLRDYLRQPSSTDWSWLGASVLAAELKFQFEGREIVQLLQTDPTIVASEELGVDPKSGRWRREVVIQHPDGHSYELISEGGYNEPDPYNGLLTVQDAVLDAREVISLEVLEGDEPSDPMRAAA